MIYRCPSIKDRTEKRTHLSIITSDFGRHLRFEGAAADKGDDRVKMLGGAARDGFQYVEIFVVPHWGLKFEVAFLDLLRPLRRFLLPKIQSLMFFAPSTKMP